MTVLREIVELRVRTHGNRNSPLLIKNYMVNIIARAVHDDVLVVEEKKTFYVGES